MAKIAAKKSNCVITALGPPPLFGVWAIAYARSTMKRSLRGFPTFGSGRPRILPHNSPAVANRSVLGALRTARAVVILRELFEANTPRRISRQTARAETVRP